MIIALGTSHTADNNASNKWIAPYYVNPDNGDQTWPEYLGEKIGQPLINLGIRMLGIETYFPRILAALSEYPETKIALIEIPSPHRFEYPLNNNNYNWGDNLNLDFWYTDLDQTYLDMLIRYGGGDLQTLKETKDILKVDKFSRPNNNATIKLKSNEMINLIYSMIKMDKKYIYDQVLIKINFIDGYLKQQGIRPIFWSMDMINFRAYSNRTPVLVDNLELLNKMSITELAYLEGWRQDDKESYADGGHLNSDKWRNMVDKYFIPYFEENVYE